MVYKLKIEKLDRHGVLLVLYNSDLTNSEKEVVSSDRLVLKGGKKEYSSKQYTIFGLSITKFIERMVDVGFFIPVLKGSESMRLLNVSRPQKGLFLTIVGNDGLDLIVDVRDHYYSHLNKEEKQRAAVETLKRNRIFDKTRIEPGHIKIGLAKFLHILELEKAEIVDSNGFKRMGFMIIPLKLTKKQKDLLAGNAANQSGARRSKRVKRPEAESGYPGIKRPIFKNP